MIRINSLGWIGSFLDAIPSSRYSRNQKVISPKKQSLESERCLAASWREKNNP